MAEIARPRPKQKKKKKEKKEDIFQDGGGIGSNNVSEKEFQIQPDIMPDLGSRTKTASPKLKNEIRKKDGNGRISSPTGTKQKGGSAVKKETVIKRVELTSTDNGNSSKSDERSAVSSADPVVKLPSAPPPSIEYVPTAPSPSLEYGAVSSHKVNIVSAPAIAPSATAPPATAQPAMAPTAIASPATALPATAPTATAPPATAPPATAPPATAPTATAPPATAPPATAPTATALPATAPPATAPPATAPPSTAPPATAPTATASPATAPLTSAPVIAPSAMANKTTSGGASSPFKHLRPILDAIGKEQYESSLKSGVVKLKPFTDKQLDTFYQNQELGQLESYIEEFIKNAKVDSKFNDLVESYYKSRLKLVEVQEKIKEIQLTVHKERKEVWTISQCTHTAWGVCGCGVKVKQEHKYQQAKFESTNLTKINTDLITLRGLIYETHQLQSYNSQTAKIRVDNFLYQLFHTNAILKKLNTHQPVSVLLPHELAPNTFPILQQLHDCISVLFTFKRFGSLEGEFSKDLQKWLDLLVGALQRVGTLQDSFFLLNHILRCPQGVVSQLAHYIQFPPFSDKVSVSVTNKPEVHHFIVMLATLTLPVRSRKEFLAKCNKKVNVSPSDGAEWTLLDETEEEIESSGDSWMMMNEHDLLKIFDQFPFDDLLKVFLNVNNGAGGETQQFQGESRSRDMMNIFAFFSCLVNILVDIFKTYNLVRYRHFIKVVTHTIRFVTQVVSEHWLNYKQYCTDVLGETFETQSVAKDITQAQTFTLQRLQVEFDQFLLKVSKKIVSSGSTGVLQFLANMPFGALSSPSIWTMMHLIIDKNIELNEVIMGDSLECSLPETFDVSPSERIFMLTVLSNMATAREVADKEFIEIITKLVVEIAFVDSSLDELHPKHGRDMLKIMVEKHIFLISSLLQYEESFLDDLEKFLVCVFEVLPIDSWKPTVNDMEKIRTWLLQRPLLSEKNKLARMLLSKLNYGFDQTGTELFIARNYHFMVAILLVEAYGIAFPDYAGGIKDPNYDEMGIFQTVGQMAVSSYTKLIYCQTHSAFDSWAWEVMLMLKLHTSELPKKLFRQLEITSDVPNEHSATWCAKTLSKLKNKFSYEFDLKETAELLNVHLSLQTKGLLAAYVAFAMTKHGHFVEMFLSDGIQYMMQLKSASLFDPVLRIVSNLARLCVDCPEKILVESFINTLMTLIHIDVKAAGYTEKLWEYFVTGMYSQTLASLVSAHINEAKTASVGDALNAIKYWITLFVKLPSWTRDCGILYQIDCLCKIAFTITYGTDTVLQILYEEFKELIKTQQSRGLFSSVISWITNNHVVSLKPNTTSDFCYFAYAALCIEMMYAHEISLNSAISTEMVTNQTLTVAQAYKNIVPNIKSNYVPPLNALCIYRWAEQAVVTPYDHPMLPLMWQQFYQLYFKKPLESSGYPSRVGIGMRFLDDTTTSLTKKMKSILYDLAKHHQEKSTTSEEHAYSHAFHDLLARFYQCLTLWLDESRLHDPNLFLNSLPEAYNSELLLKIFQGNQDLWYDYIDMKTMEKELDVLINVWRFSIFRPVGKQTSSATEEVSRGLKSGRHISKLLTRVNTSSPPPRIIHPVQVVAEISFHVMLTQPSLVQNIGNDLQHMVMFAKTLSALQASQVGLDSEFIDELPNMYENVHRKLVVGIPCLGKKNLKNLKSGGTCSNPAEVTIELTELQLFERIYNVIEKNRKDFDEVLQKACSPISDSLCHGVIYVETIIQKLSESFNLLNSTQQTALHHSAKHLFYLLAELINGEVKRCHPAIQFFSSGVESLGKKFIADNPSEQVALLEIIVKQEQQSVMFLAPFFTPMSSLDSFVQLYRTVISFIKTDRATTVFVLLSKFDLNVWIQTSPGLNQKHKMSNLAMKALRKIGAKPSKESMMILEVMRSHMLVLLNSDINEIFNKILVEFLDSSGSCSIAVACWDDLITCLGYHNKDGTLDALYVGQVKESVQFLAHYFANVLVKNENRLDDMYEKWEPYMDHFSQLLSGLFRQLIYHMASRRDEFKQDSLMREIWEYILSIYQPWLVPKGSGKIWSLLRIHSVTHVLKSFVETIQMAISLTKDYGYCIFLNYVWTYYFKSIVQSVKEEQSLDVFHVHFLSLPWILYRPTVHELDCALQTFSVHPCAFRFYGSLLSEIDWPNVVKSYLTYDKIETTGQLHQKLFNLLVMMAADIPILQQLTAKLTYLFKTAKTFQWNLLGLEETGHVLRWYSENVDSSLILQKESFLYTTLDLCLHVCGFTTKDENLDNLSLQRRNLYTQMIVTLLARCSSLKDCKERIHEFRHATEKLLDTIESIFKFNKVNPLEELVMHISSTLNLLNLISNQTLYQSFMASIESYLLRTGCSMVVLAVITATSISVASIEQMVFIIEKAISCHFMRLSDGELLNSWSPVINAFMVPELEIDNFMDESLKQKAILTLYTYSVHCVSKSDKPSYQLDVLFDIVHWCTKIQPDRECESKFLLLWLQIFNIVHSQTPRNMLESDAQRLNQYMLLFAKTCLVKGEEKIYDGVLGMIGIGRRNPLSKEFRLTAKAVHLFLLYHLQPASFSPSPSPDTDESSSSTATDLDAHLTTFSGLLKNKNYSTQHVQINWVLEFVSEPLRSIRDGRDLVIYLCKAFFEKENFIAASVT